MMKYIVIMKLVKNNLYKRYFSEITFLIRYIISLLKFCIRGYNVLKYELSCLFSQLIPHMHMKKIK